MSDLISRQDAIDALSGNVTVTGRANAYAVQSYANGVIEKIKALPSARPTGKWVEDYETEREYQLMFHKVWQCPFCGEKECRPKPSDFCPNCGAQMEADHE